MGFFVLLFIPTLFLHLKNTCFKKLLTVSNIFWPVPGQHCPVHNWAIFQTLRAQNEKEEGEGVVMIGRGSDFAFH